MVAVPWSGCPAALDNIGVISPPRPQSPLGCVLLTGGAGYLGTHTAVVLLEAGYSVVVVDDLSNSSEEAVRRAGDLVPDAVGELRFHPVDLRDGDRLAAVFEEGPIDAVIHLAGLKAVGESVTQPLRYFDNNLGGTLRLVEVMAEHGVRDLVFSSSATVYGMAERMPIDEDTPLSALNPYARTKVMVEEVLGDVAIADPSWHVTLLRYFNPVGAHPSGRIGEDPQGHPNNLMPFIMQVAVGRRPEVVVFGDDYPTPDGTGIRDYIHVMDLAEGHLAALRHLHDREGCHAVNLGTGRGHSVLEVLAAVGAAAGRAVPYRVGRRRPGDAPVSFADPRRAHEWLGWRASRGLDEMCADAWRWQSANPQGYGAPARWPADASTGPA
jgi:UDP-glucose 4-epimerase